MQNFIVCDSRGDFLRDISNSMMLDAYPFSVTQTKTISEAAAKAAQSPGAVLVLSETVLRDAEPSSIPSGAYGYANTPSGNQHMGSLGVPSIGFFRTSGDLLAALCNDPLQVTNSGMIASASRQTPAQQAPQQPRQQAQPQPQRQQGQGQQRQFQQPRQQGQQSQQKPQNRPQGGAQRNNTPPPPKAAPVQPQKFREPVQPVSQPAYEPETIDTQPAQTPQMPQLPGQPAFTPEMMAMMMQMMQQMNQASGNTTPPPQMPQQSNADQYIGAGNTQAQPAQEEAYDDGEDEEPRHPSGGRLMRNRKKEREEQSVDEEVDEDLLARAVDQQRTKVVTVYAAKGGVGKTSISTELAVCLALTSNGRRRFRVCIVDCNIDFGDVSTTLELKDDGPNMSYWASEIREILEHGTAADDINFTRAQMEQHYLQLMKDTGLYALCAPIVHEDSMLIKDTEIRVMLRNIIDNGEFDFVICDTGNNTRDSSIIALDNSEYVLLVATQDVTTANCNASVLRTLTDIGFDTNKVRLVINNAMSSRETGISVQEVEETFPYQCVCRIKRTSDIIRANNLGRPLVYKPNHEYTKQIQRIVRFITQGDVPEEPKKKGLFGFSRR